MAGSSIYMVQLALGGKEAKRAVETITQAINKAKGSIPQIAQELGVSPRSVFRILAKANLSVHAERVREQAQKVANK